MRANRNLNPKRIVHLRDHREDRPSRPASATMMTTTRRIGRWLSSPLLRGEGPGMRGGHIRCDRNLQCRLTEVHGKPRRIFYTHWDHEPASVASSATASWTAAVFCRFLLDLARFQSGR